MGGKRREALKNGIIFSLVLLGAGFLFLKTTLPADATHVDCPTEVTITTPIDIMFVLDDSGSMEAGTRIPDAKTAANDAVDKILALSRESKIGLAFMNLNGTNLDIESGLNLDLGLTSDAGQLHGNINQLHATWGTPMVETINRAAEMLDSATNKKVIMFFSDGGFPTTGLSAKAQAITRAGVRFGNDGSLASTQALVSDLSLAKDAPNTADLAQMFNQIITQVTKNGDADRIDSDGDRHWPARCADVPGNVCGINGNPPCDDHFDEPSDLDPSLAEDTRVIDCNGTQRFLREVLRDRWRDLDCDGVTSVKAGGNDYYDNPYDFSLNIIDSNIPDPAGVRTGWLKIFHDAKADDLDQDGHRVVKGRLKAGNVADPNPGGDDWYDNFFTDEFVRQAVKPTLKQLHDTLNDLDLDGYARADSGAQPSESAARDVNGCVNPSALEGATCPAGKTCKVVQKDSATGRVPENAFNTGAPGPVAPHPWDLCEIIAFYGCNREQVLIPDGEPPLTHNGNALVQAKYQCYDTEGGVAVDNNLDGKANTAAAECQDRDIDGDGVINAANNDCVAAGQCDFYDNPADFGANACDPLSGEAGKTLLDAFRRTTDDLDQDHEPAAKGRLGNRIAFFKTPTGKDWYDNPFTSDLSLLSQKPTLLELRQTLNDLDLDGYLVKSWVSLFGKGESFEPDTADVTPKKGEDGNVKNIAGCINPRAREGTCIDCIVSPPSPATGRVPQEKATPFVDEKKVCQLEAYYVENKDKGEPATIITSGGIDLAKSFFTITAQCKDAVDNNLNGLVDSEDISCPTIGGLVICGRHSDDPTTFIVESEPCNACHFFFLFERIINRITFRFAPVLAVLLVALGGFFIATSKENAERMKLGKNIAVWALIGYVIVLSSWIIANSALAMFDVVSWTGFRSEKVGGGVVTYNAGALDTIGVSIPVKNDEFNGLYLTANKQARWIIDTIEPNTVVTNGWNGSLKAGDTFEIVKGGWWQFSCEKGEAKVPPNVVLAASEGVSKERDPVRLIWQSVDAISCVASASPASPEWTGAKSVACSPTCSQWVNPPSPGTYSYKLECTFVDNVKKEATVSVEVKAAPSVDFTADQGKIPEAGSTNLRWSVQNAEKCAASGAEFWTGEKSALGGVSEIKPPPFPRDYKLILSCQGLGGERSKEISLSVELADPPVKTVFITSRAYSANLGGLDGADAKCQERANTAGIPGTFKAWLSDRAHSAAGRIKPVPETSPFYRLDGKKIADSWADLLDESLQEPIRVNEFGKEAGLYEEAVGVFHSLVWTATEPNGTFTRSGDSDCSGWSTSASSEEKGPGLGDFMKKDSFWTKAGKNTHCDSARPLYCFETN